MNDESKNYGYVGSIVRINLTDSTTEIVSTMKYVPKYIGGRAICNKIFWDEVKEPVEALSAENKIIFMTGPTTATGIPTGGRTVFTGISPNSFPEQYCWSGIGGWVGAELKFAGFDGFILEGKADKPTYLFIEDGNVQFLSADSLWGLKVHDSQRKLQEIHGKDVQSIVIGPAGENLMRNASITTSNDNVAAKGGFGAVFGYKNLKAISVRGTGEVVPADIKKLFELRAKIGDPQKKPNPVIHETEHGMDGNRIPVRQGWIRGQVACSHGCNQQCNRLMMGVKSAFSDEKVNLVEKCVGIFAYGFQEDCCWLPVMTYETEQNYLLPCKLLSGKFPEPDPTDPYFEDLYKKVKGDIVNYWKPDFDKGSVMMDMCNEYGIDKWDVIVWYFTWLSAAKKEGLLDEMDFGMEVDVENEDFVKYFLDMITYRKGKYGPIFAEGMARAIRALGKENFGDTIYKGRFSQEIPGKQLDIPVSLETAWGHSFHWQGRGFEGTIDKPGWVATSLALMTTTRDVQTIAHHHDTYTNFLKIKDDPCRSPLTANAVIMNENKAQMKDSVTTCEFVSPNLFWTDMEAQMFTAATGIQTTEKELDEAAERCNLLFRAIIMRHSGRCREQEVNAIFPTMQYPDPLGQTVEWDEWNDLVDIYYEKRGWDKETGWPTRETWTKYGLDYIADEMNKLGMLPPERRTEYTRKENPFKR